MSFGLLSDAPASRDLLNFDRYWQPLLSVIASDTTVTPLTIGIFGTWGSGKSTLLEILRRKLEEDPQQRFVCVQFNPWVHRKEPNLLVPLLHALRDALEQDPMRRFKESAGKIFDVLARLGADELLKHFTAGMVSLDKLEKYEKAYLDRRVQAESQLRNLRKALQEEAAALHARSTRLVFFIDDLDRCEPVEVVDLLESVKLFLDIENVVHVLAFDKEVVDRGIEIKYDKYSFAKDRAPVIGSEYLEKMIQVPVHLYPLHPAQVRGYIGALDQSEDVQKQIELLAAALSPNPRKIKRLLNALAFTNYVINADPEQYGPLKDRTVATALGIMRVEEPGLYLEVARLPRLLVALEEVYADKRNAKNVNNFQDFGQRAEAVRGLCEKYYRPTSFLAAIFKATKFSTFERDLPLYISVLGGF